MLCQCGLIEFSSFSVTISKDEMEVAGKSRDRTAHYLGLRSSAIDPQLLRSRASRENLILLDKETTCLIMNLITTHESHALDDQVWTCNM